MEKTFASVSSMMLGQMGPRNMEVSPGFCALVRSIRKASSQSEIDEIIERELGLIRQKLAQADTSLKRVKEFLVRLVYCEMLGHAAPFGYITALKLSQQGSLKLKRVGYLAVCLFLHPQHELLLLLVNTIQRDLNSTNILENCMAMTAASQLFGADMITPILPAIEEKMQHSNNLVRKKAIMTMFAFLKRAPHLVQHMGDKFKQALCDRDPSVMGAALHILNWLICANPNSYQSLVRPLVSIQAQILSKKLSSSFEYHNLPAPWMQIRLMKILSRLGAGNEYSSNLMYDVLEETLKKAAYRHDMAYAVQYECMVTIASIHPSGELIKLATMCVAKFLKSKDNNLKYLGIKALSHLLNADPECATEHQMVVVECLTDEDPSIRNKTIDLLYKMTNESNVAVICEKFLDHLQTTKEKANHQKIVHYIINLAEKYHTSLRWYLTTICEVYRKSDEVTEEVVERSIKTIEHAVNAEGDAVLASILDVILPVVSEKALNKNLLQLASWVLGEFSSSNISSLMASDAMAILIGFLEESHSTMEARSKVIILTAFGKAVAKCESHEIDSKVLTVLLSDSNSEVRQRAAEVTVMMASSKMLLKHFIARKNLLKEEFDWTLSFLDAYVSDALEKGAKPYKPKQQRGTEQSEGRTLSKPDLFAGLNFQPYEAPSNPSFMSATTSSMSPPNKTISNGSPSPSLGSSGGMGTGRLTTEDTGASSLRLDGVKKVWDKSGYLSNNSKKKPKESFGDSSPVSEPQSPSDTTQPTHKITESVGSLTASVQLSDAMATGRPTDSQNIAVAVMSQEAKQMRELAAALFGNTSSSGKEKEITKLRKKNETTKEVQNILDKYDQMELLTDGTDVEVSISSAKPILVTTSAEKNRERLKDDSSMQTTKSPSIYDDFYSQEDSHGKESHLSDEKSMTQNVLQESFLSVEKSQESEEKSLPDVDLKNSGGLDAIKDLDIQTEEVAQTIRDENSIESLLRDFDQLQPSIGVGDKTTSLNSSMLLDSSHDTSTLADEQELLTTLHLPNGLSVHPHSKEFELLCNDVMLRLSLCKVWKPGELSLAFLVSNKSNVHHIDGVKLTTTLPSNLKCNKAEEQKVSLSIEDILPNSTQTMEIICTCQSTALSMTVGGEIAYKDHTHSLKRMFYSTGIQIRDLLRSHKISTSEFGQLWTQPSRNKKGSIENCKMKIDQIMEVLASQLGFHIVEIIGMEAISSATLLQASVCLLHIKLQKSKLDIWVKSKNQQLSDHICKQCVAVLLSP